MSVNPAGAAVKATLSGLLAPTPPALYAALSVTVPTSAYCRLAVASPLASKASCTPAPAPPQATLTAVAALLSRSHSGTSAALAGVGLV